jgi:thioredoxin-like negative regulator of GroEL
MQRLTSQTFHSFLSSHRIAAVHFDAEWDAHRARVRQSMLDAEATLSDCAGFAEVDVDTSVDLARSIGVANVPLVAYYRDGQLVAALVGADQNVKARTERVLRGDPIGYNDGTSPTSHPPRPWWKRAWDMITAR